MVPSDFYEVIQAKIDILFRHICTSSTYTIYINGALAEFPQEHNDILGLAGHFRRKPMNWRHVAIGKVRGPFFLFHATFTWNELTTRIINHVT